MLTDTPLRVVVAHLTLWDALTQIEPCVAKTANCWALCMQSLCKNITRLVG